MAAADGFVGREPELEKIGILLLGSARLITLIGAGGIGKTRLATEIIHRFRTSSRAPVYWARLARLAKGSDVAAIEDEVAAAVVDADFSGRSAWDVLVDTLTRTDARGRSLRTVLVLDNCEHVLGGAGRLIAELLAALPGLTILATSREAVGWVDEHLVSVTPLSQQQALALFRRRAELTGHPITDRDEIAMATLICRHMHNNPLYIQLAAARLLRQPLAGILGELSGESTDKRMRWSHAPRLGAQPRHRGVGDVIAWSYDLCSDKERLLLDRMSVFAVGYDTSPEDESSSVLDVGADLDAIEWVCADDRSSGHDPDERDGDPDVRLAADEIEGLLERLIDQSLVTVHITPTTVRYSLLESIRVFAYQRLEMSVVGGVAESSRIARRHRRYYRNKVVQTQLNWFSPAEQNWTRAAWDNILVAIETSLTSGESTLGLEISAGLIALPFFKGSPREVRQWTERTLQATRASTPQPTELQIGAMTSIAWLDVVQGRNEDAERTLEQCAAACVGDPTVAPNWRQAPETDIGLPAPVEFVWGAILLLAHRDPKAITVLARAREKFAVLGDHGGAARSELYEAVAAGLLGSARQALEITRRHLDHATASGAGWAKSWAELAWAITLTKHGDPTEALTIGRTTLTRQVAVNDTWCVSMAIYVRTWSLARIMSDMIAAGGADRARLRALATEAAQLAGGARAEPAGPGVDFDNLAVVAHETAMAMDVARTVLGDKAFAAAERQGSLLRSELGEVQRLALGTLSMDRLPRNHPARMNLPSHWGELSGAEQQIAILAAAGWPNSAIADHRGTSVRTVDAQMAAVFHKLTITSREDIVTLVPKDRMGDVRMNQRVG